MPEVSVIVPNYNHAGFLRERLDSIFSQDFQSFEVILLDDHSSDNSNEILEQYASNPKVVHYIKNDKNSGSPFAQWIKAFALCSGRFVWIAESDDYSHPAFLSRCVEVFQKEKDIRLVYTASSGVTTNGVRDDHFVKWIAEVSKGRWAADYVNTGEEEIRSALSVRNTIGNTSSVVMDRETVAPLIKSVAGFRYTGDWYLWLVVLSQPGARVGFVSEPLNYFRSPHAETTRTRQKLGYLYADEWFRCLHAARAATHLPRYPAIALADINFMLLVVPLRSFFQRKALVKLSGWLFKDTLLPRMVLASLITRGVIWFRMRTGKRS
jgi:glycosyltransferase involved in cell wall biosynthesis